MFIIHEPSYVKDITYTYTYNMNILSKDSRIYVISIITPSNKQILPTISAEA